MDNVEPRAAALVTGTLQSEMVLIREAVLLVATGGSPRVILAGLRFGEALLGPARSLAAQHGVRIRPRWWADDAGVDVAVERATSAA